MGRIERGIALALTVLTTTSCKIAYLSRSSYYQLELLRSRVPIEEARGSLDPQQAAALDLVADVKAFGKDIGLQSTDNYGTIALDWDRTIWNVTGCDPVSFKPKTWWFPVVGKFPYLGFFREDEAKRLADRLSGRGFDVYMRTAGAYSTLGWFKDPLLVPMLSWSELDIAETILHELAHATVWIKGSVEFNESFANFVGETAAIRYLEARHGAVSPEASAARAEIEDVETWRRLQRGLYEDLERVYDDPLLDRDRKLAEKSALLTGLVDRVRGAEFHEQERFLRSATQGTWNNARLIQFRTYNQNRDWFQALYESSGTDLLVFMERVSEITDGARDPYEALAEAAQPKDVAGH